MKGRRLSAYCEGSTHLRFVYSNTASLVIGDLTGPSPKAGVDRPVVSVRG